MSLKSRANSLKIPLLLLALTILVVACKKEEKPPELGVYATPDAAAQALDTAVKAGDINALVGIFGPDSRQLILSGDDVQDKNNASEFAARYDVMHRWRKMPDDSQMLIVGADNFPFPIPLKKNPAGQWYFDTAAGRTEVLNRRIGRNELAIIQVCAAVAEAQGDYYNKPHDGQQAKQFAVKFISDPGKQNGLYWPAAQGQPQSPLGPLAANATSEGYTAKPEGHTAFHGYYFHMLQGQTNNTPSGARDYIVNGKMTTGFAFVAYPAEYGNSGIMTFIINQDGVLLEKDLGKTTTQIATAMTQFDPDPTWTIVQPD
jgi:Protein of unknown function (DUF2950)